jgi:hypothetical protein
MKSNNKRTVKLKEIINIKNKTRKKLEKAKMDNEKSRPTINKSLINLSKEQKGIVCKNFFNKYETFEDKIEDTFKKNNIDFLSTNYNLEKQILKDLRKAVSPSKINPQNDFYSYINDRWLKEFEVQTGQEYIIQIDNFRLVQDKVFRELIEIVDNYILDNNSNNSNNKKFVNCLKTYYHSCNHYNTDDQSAYYANYFVLNIDELRKDKGNLWNLLGLLNHNEIISYGSPFIWSLNPDDKNPQIYRCYIEASQLSLIDINTIILKNTHDIDKYDYYFNETYTYSSVCKYFNEFHNIETDTILYKKLPVDLLNEFLELYKQYME